MSSQAPCLNACAGRCNFFTGELCTDFIAIQINVVVVETKLVQIEPDHSCINAKMLCYHDDGTCTSAPSFVRFIDDNSSTDSLSSTGNASYF